MSLNQYFWTNTERPINKWLHYLPIYERAFAPFRNRRIVFLEIGAGQGGSSQMWKHYFGPGAQIVSIDIRPECAAFADEQVAIRIGDQSDTVFLQTLIDEFGAPDVVLDDGSHHMDHVNATFNYLYPRLAREALYMVEDLHTAYWPNWGGGLRKPGTFIERMKGLAEDLRAPPPPRPRSRTFIKRLRRLIDELHAGNPHHPSEADAEIPSSEISRMTRSVQFYDSVVVIEKGAALVKESRSIPLIEGQTVW